MNRRTKEGIRRRKEIVPCSVKYLLVKMRELPMGKDLQTGKFGIMLEDKISELEKLQLYALVTNVQTFVDQFSIKSLDQVLTYIDLKDEILFPVHIKSLAKSKFTALLA